MSSDRERQQARAAAKELLDVARKLCRQAGDILQRADMHGWSEEPYDWDAEISEYLFIMDERNQ